MARLTTLAAWQALTGEEALTGAEQALIAACRVGELCRLGDDCPKNPDPKRSIRADLLRDLILGGWPDCELAEQGVHLQGAFITGKLDLNFARASGATGLIACRFEQPIDALQARFETLGLSGSHLPGLNAPSAQVTGAVFLRRVTATGEVCLANATIGGPLACDSGHFANAGGKALHAQDAQVTGSVFLSEGFAATGEVSLAGARIGGQLSCSGGRFNNTNGDALNAERMHVEAIFFWRNVTVEAGVVVLAAAHVGDLADDAESWPGNGRLILHGFTYDRLSATFTDAKARLDWLAKGTRWKQGDEEVFFPQPYTQMAKVLREMGHDRDARQVLMARERLLAAEQMKADRKRLEDLRNGTAAEHGDIGAHWLRMQLFRLGNALMRLLVGYGFAPQRALYCAAVILVFMTVFYFIVYKAGGMVPNSPVVLVSPDWAAALAEDGRATGRLWAETAPSAAHYETFWSGFYAADVFIPLVDFGQEAAWTATTKTAMGIFAFILTFVFKAVGWLITALGAAAIAGIIRKP